jgi:hypothetical protein
MKFKNADEFQKGSSCCMDCERVPKPKRSNYLISVTDMETKKRIDLLVEKKIVKFLKKPEEAVGLLVMDLIEKLEKGEDKDGVS